MSELKREHTVTYECRTCTDAPQFDSGQEFKKHLLEVHKLEASNGVAKLCLHLDTATHFINTYECEAGGIQFFKTTNTERESAFRRRCFKAK